MCTWFELKQSLIADAIEGKKMEKKKKKRKENQIKEKDRKGKFHGLGQPSFLFIFTFGSSFPAH